MLTCEQVTALITDYLEGRLPFGKRLMFQLHIGMCRHCRRYLRQMRLTIRTVGKLPTEPPSDEVKRELLERFKNWKP